MSDERKECISFHPKEALCPKVMTAKELFEGRHYVIPKYQRDYVWEEKNILPFVQAIAEGAEEYVFMGTMLFRKIGDDKFEVMDGRQRLTTMAALLRSCGEMIEGRETLLDDSVNKMIGVFEKVKREVGVEGSESEFSKRLLNSVYFVVVDSTLNTGKTFEIFKAINMTGVSLADEDAVKVIYAEHIAPDCEGKSDDERLMNAVKKVNDLYNIVKGKKCLKPGDVLDVLKAILVASKGGTFDDFAQKKVDFFTAACKTDDSNLKKLLSFNSVELLFKVCEYVADRAYGNVRFDVEVAKQQYFRGLFESTRYNRFWLLPYMDVFFRLLKSGGAFGESAAAALNEASKNAFEAFRLFAVYSVIYQKQVSEINTFVCNEIFPKLRDGCTSEELAETVNGKLSGNDEDSGDSWRARWFSGYLCEGWDEGLYSNRNRAKLVCVMSELAAMLEEGKRDDEIREALFSWGKETSLKDAKGNTYKGKYDCDHILARKLFNDRNYETKFCNGIGNLTLLSDRDNKAAQDKKPKIKAEEYYKKQDVFVEPRKVAENIAEEGWKAEQIAARQNKRVAKIWEFLRLGDAWVKQPHFIEANEVDPKNVDGRKSSEDK